MAGPAGRPAPPTLWASLYGRKIEHPVPLTPWKASLHVPGLGLREHSKPLLGARRKRVLRIAISSGRRRWPVPPVGPPLPRSGPAYTAATSSTRCRSRPGELKTVSRQGPICLLLGGAGRGFFRGGQPPKRLMVYSCSYCLFSNLSYKAEKCLMWD